MTAIHKSGYEGKIKIGMDCAASEFHKDGLYDLGVCAHHTHTLTHSLTHLHTHL